MPTAIPEFIEQHCIDCHDDVEMKGNLDLDALLFEPLTPENRASWINVFDAAQSDEMPPAKKKRPDSEHLQTFLNSLSGSIKASEHERLETNGRASNRRLNRYEFENSLRDLLSLPNLEIRDNLPEDGTAHGFNKLNKALDISHVQMARFMESAEQALNQAVIPSVKAPQTFKEKYYTWQQPGFIKIAPPTLRLTFPIVGLELQPDLIGGRDRVAEQWIIPDLPGASKPERVEDEAVVMLTSTYEPSEIQFNKFRAEVSGRYILRFSGYTVWMNNDFSEVSKGRRNEPIAIYADSPPRILRPLGKFDFEPDATVHSLDVWLKAGETIRPDATRLVRPRGTSKNPLQEADGMPGVAFQWMEVEGPIFDQWPTAGHKLLFADLPLTETIDDTVVEVIEKADPGDPANDAGQVLPEHLNRKKNIISVSSPTPQKDAEALLRRFMERAYRRPVQESEVQPILQLVKGALKNNHSFKAAMISGYVATLVSPGYLYIKPNRGELDSHSLAERLSFFLWNSPPDAQLLKLASSGDLLDHQTLNQQVDRLLDDPRSRRFSDSFLDYWLDLRHMNASTPDEELYPDYQLNDNLIELAQTETQLYFYHLIENNLSAKNLVDSDFLIINERLAKHYDIPNVSGVHFRKVPLPENNARGGLMTQASVLKVTANGTLTSPILRGAWIMERMLGYHAAPPPVVEVPDPDIRGATTIREQLALHRSDTSCNSCHQKIDPVGFALENFDVMGAWRDFYRNTADGEGPKAKGIGHNGKPFLFRKGLPVDATGKLYRGDSFSDVRDLKKMLTERDTQLAENITEQLLTYATGAPVHFSDRQSIAKILQRSRASDYGLRDLIKHIVSSDLFLNR
ncbi:MAG: DUF1592 domain-containing protein [Verrucomicrobiota bacterium]